MKRAHFINAMQSALGVTGIEGTFRAAMEATLHALRCSSTAQSELLASHCQEASLIWNAAHHVSALAKVRSMPPHVLHQQ